MSHGPLVSVIVPVYNGEKYLAEALESAQSQTYAPVELVVIDDGSTDASFEVAGRFAHARRVQQRNAGISAARNRGIELARGDFIALLDADDVWLPDKLALQVRALEGDSNIGMVFGYVAEFISPELPAEIKNTLRCEQEAKPGVIPSALCVRREAFQRIGAFETQWQVGEFASWMLRAHEGNVPWATLPDLIVRRRVHMTNNGYRQRHAFNQYAQLIKGSLIAAARQGERIERTAFA